MKTLFIIEFCKRKTVRQLLLLTIMIFFYALVGRTSPWIHESEVMIIGSVDSVRAQWFGFNTIQDIQPITQIQEPKDLIIERLLIAMKHNESACKKYGADPQLASVGPTGVDEYTKALIIADEACVVDDALKMYSTPGYAEIAVSRAEVFKILAKTMTIQNDTVFNEYVYNENAGGYKDVKLDSRYTPYIAFAKEKKLTSTIDSGFFFNRKLKPLQPIQWNEFDRILKKANITYSGPRNGQYVTKKALVHSIVTSMSNQLINEHELYGNNKVIYHWILSRLQGKSIEDQRSLLIQLKDGLEKIDSNSLTNSFGLHKEGIISLIDYSLVD